VAAAGGVPLSGFLTAFPDDADDDRAALFGWQRMQEAAAARGSPPTLEYDDDDDDDDLPAPVSEWALPAVATVVLADGTEVQGLLKGSSTELVSTLAHSYPRTLTFTTPLSIYIYLLFFGISCECSSFLNLYIRSRDLTTCNCAASVV
jgi:hypothetical protein